MRWLDLWLFWPGERRTPNKLYEDIPDQLFISRFPSRWLKVFSTNNNRISKIVTTLESYLEKINSFPVYFFHTHEIFTVLLLGGWGGKSGGGCESQCQELLRTLIDDLVAASCKLGLERLLHRSASGCLNIDYSSISQFLRLSPVIFPLIEISIYLHRPLVHDVR